MPPTPTTDLRDSMNFTIETNTNGRMRRNDSEVSLDSLGQLGDEKPVVCRRRSSGIAFEKHDSIIFDELSSMIDEERDERRSYSSSRAKHNQNLEGSISLFGADATAPALPAGGDGSVSAFRGSFNRRLSDISVDLDELTAAISEVASLYEGEDDEDCCEDRSIVGKIQDSIISKEVRNGRLHENGMSRFGESMSSILSETSSAFARRVSFRLEMEGLAEVLEELRGIDEGLDDDDGQSRVTARTSGQASYVPPPPGTRPRRSSMKKPEDCRDWSSLA